MDHQLNLIPALNKVVEATSHVIQSYKQPLAALDTKEGRALAQLRGRTANLALLVPACLLPLSREVVEQLESLMDSYENLDFDQFNSHLRIITEDVESAAQRADRMKQLCAKYERDAAALGGELHQAIKAASASSTMAGAQATGYSLAAFFFAAVALVTGGAAVAGFGAQVAAGVAGGADAFAAIVLGGSSVASGMKTIDHNAASEVASDRQTRLSGSVTVVAGSVAPAAALLTSIATDLRDFFAQQEQSLKLRAAYTARATGNDRRLRLEHAKLKMHAGRIKRECTQFLELACNMQASFTQLEKEAVRAGDYSSAYLAKWKADATPRVQ